MFNGADIFSRSSTYNLPRQCCKTNLLIIKLLKKHEKNYFVKRFIHSDKYLWFEHELRSHDVLKVSDVNNTVGGFYHIFKDALRKVRIKKICPGKSGAPNRRNKVNAIDSIKPFI